MQLCWHRDVANRIDALQLRVKFQSLVGMAAGEYDAVQQDYLSMARLKQNRISVGDFLAQSFNSEELPFQSSDEPSREPSRQDSGRFRSLQLPLQLPGVDSARIDTCMDPRGRVPTLVLPPEPAANVNVNALSKSANALSKSASVRILARCLPGCIARSR